MRSVTHAYLDRSSKVRGRSAFHDEFKGSRKSRHRSSWRIIMGDRCYMSMAIGGHIETLHQLSGLARAIQLEFGQDMDDPALLSKMQTEIIIAGTKNLRLARIAKTSVTGHKR